MLHRTGQLLVPSSSAYGGRAGPAATPAREAERVGGAGRLAGCAPANPASIREMRRIARLARSEGLLLIRAELRSHGRHGVKVPMPAPHLDLPGHRVERRAPFHAVSAVLSRRPAWPVLRAYGALSRAGSLDGRHGSQRSTCAGAGAGLIPIPGGPRGANHCLGGHRWEVRSASPDSVQGALWSHGETPLQVPTGLPSCLCASRYPHLLSIVVESGALATAGPVRAFGSAPFSTGYSLGKGVCLAESRTRCPSLERTQKWIRRPFAWIRESNRVGAKRGRI